MAILVAMLIVSSTGSIASIGHWAELSGCESSIPRVVDWYRANNVDVLATCEILPPFSQASRR
jgi:hypothetical protein